MDIQSFILLLSSTIGGLAFFIVLLKMRAEIIEKYFFLLFIFSLSYYSFVVFLIQSKLIIEYPHFFRTASPSLYCLSIAFYLYYKSHVQRSDWRKNRSIYLLIIPTIHVLELLPFYLQGTSVKRQYLLDISNNSDDVIYSFEGWIPTSWHFVLQLSLGIVLFTLVLVDIYKKKLISKRKSDNIINWFMWAGFFQLVCFGLLLVFLFIDSPVINVYGLATLVFSIIQLIVIVNLFLQPQLLYGKSYFKRRKRIEKLKSGIAISEQGIASYQLKVENFFTNETSFLNSDFRQQDLANAINLSRNNLSFIINKVYQMNFNQLLNKKRIEVVLDKFQKNKVWDKYSLSGIAKEAGFKSRTTFIKAFKSNTGMTPSKYINSRS